MEYDTQLYAMMAEGTQFSCSRVGFKDDLEDFLGTLSEEARVRGMWVKKNALQLADVTPLGFVAYSLRDNDAETLVDFLNHYSKLCVINKGWQPAIFGAETKMLWDDALEDVCKHHSKKEKNALKAIHIIGSTQGAEHTQQVLKAFFKSTTFRKNYNVPFKAERICFRNNSSFWNLELCSRVIMVTSL